MLGCPDLAVLVDHKPLLKIFGDRCLSDITNPRLFNLKEKTLRFGFETKHVPGAKNHVADSLSRHPVGAAEHLVLPDDVGNLSDLACLSVSSLSSICEPQDDDDTQWLSAVDELRGNGPMQAVTWDEVRLQTSSDPMMQTLLETTESGFPEVRSEVPTSILPFYRLREGLYTVDGVVCYNGRTVIPPSLRTRVLEILHSAHQCTTQMTGHAELNVFLAGNFW